MTLTDRKMSLQLPDTSPAGPVSGKLYIAYETNYNDHLNYFYCRVRPGIGTFQGQMVNWAVNSQRSGNISETAYIQEQDTQLQWKTNTKLYVWSVKKHHSHRGASRLKNWGDQGLGPNTGASEAGLGVGAGGGCLLPPWGRSGCHPRKIFENSDAKSCILWLLRSLVGSRGRVYPSKQQACQGLNQFQNFNFSAVVEPTRSSADADNRLDAFSGQSRSTNMVPFHM